MRRSSIARTRISMADAKDDESKFDKLNARLDALKKDAAGYKGSEVEDLADGLVDDVADLKKRVDKTKKDVDKKKTGSMITAVDAAAVIAVLAFVFGPKRAGAMEQNAMLAFSNSPTKVV